MIWGQFGPSEAGLLWRVELSMEVKEEEELGADGRVSRGCEAALIFPPKCCHALKSDGNARGEAGAPRFVRCEAASWLTCGVQGLAHSVERSSTSGLRSEMAQYFA